MNRFRVYNFIFFKDELCHSTNKIILPITYINNYTNMYENSNHLNFVLQNDNKKLIVGLLEFSDIDIIYVPKWIQDYFNITDGDYLDIIYNSEIVEKGTKCIIQAQDVDFLKIQDPCKVLENVFNNYTVIFKDQMIFFNFNDIEYSIKIINIEPGDIVDIIDVDLNIDFIEPVGYQEYLNKIKQLQKPKIVFKNEIKDKKDEPKKFIPFSGKGYSLKD